MADKQVIVNWADFYKVVTTNDGEHLLHSTKEDDEGKLVHRSAICMDVAWSGTVSMTYERELGVPDTYSFQLSAYHQPAWWVVETSTTITYDGLRTSTPAYGRVDVSPEYTEGPVQVNAGTELSPDWRDQYLKYDFTYTIINPLGTSACDPEDCQFLLTLEFFADISGRYIDVMRDSGGKFNLREVKYKRCWIADINTTLAKPFPDGSTQWELQVASINLNDYRYNAHPTRAVWPSITPWNRYCSDFQCPTRSRDALIDISTVTPTVTFHEEDPGRPWNN